MKTLVLAGLMTHFPPSELHPPVENVNGGIARLAATAGIAAAWAMAAGAPPSRFATSGGDADREMVRLPPRTPTAPESPTGSTRWKTRPTVVRVAPPTVGVVPPPHPPTFAPAFFRMYPVGLRDPHAVPGPGEGLVPVGPQVPVPVHPPPGPQVGWLIGGFVGGVGGGVGGTGGTMMGTVGETFVGGCVVGVLGGCLDGGVCVIGDVLGGGCVTVGGVRGGVCVIGDI